MLPGPGDGSRLPRSSEDVEGQANDTWIAACALTYGLPLATLNVKDFEDFAEHDGLQLITRSYSASVNGVR